MPPPTIKNAQSSNESRIPSSSIFANFRNLLGPRKSQIFANSSSSTTSKIDKFTTLQPNTEQLGGKNGNPKRPFDHSVGSAQFESILEQLGADHATKERCKAASSLVQIIGEYANLDIGAIWQQGADLLETPYDSPDFEAGLLLFEACLGCEDVETHERRMFFDTIWKQLLPHLSICINRLRQLTLQGRKFDSLDMTRVVGLLEKLLQLSHDALSTARKNLKSQKGGSFATEYDTLADIFNLMNDSVKFSAIMFSDKQLAGLMRKHLEICLHTSQESILEQGVEFFGTVITYASLPLSQFSELLVVLCSIYGSIGHLKPAVKAVIWKLLVSHLGSQTVDRMLTVVVESKKDAFRLRGAIAFLQEMIMADADEEIARPTLFAILSAISSAFNCDSVNAEAEYDVLILLHQIVTHPATLPSLLDEATWVVFTDVLGSCAYGAAAVTFDSGQTLDQPAAKSIEKDCLSALENVRDALLNLVDNPHSESMVMTSAFLTNENDRSLSIMTVLLRLSRFLDDDTLSSVLSFHSRERLHLGPRQGWFQTCRHLRKGVFQDERRSIEARLSAFSLLKEAYSTAIAFGLRESEVILEAMMKSLRKTVNPLILQPLADMLVDIAAFSDNAGLFDAITQTLRAILLRPITESTGLRDASVVWPSLTLNGILSHSIVAKALVNIFLRTLNKSFAKANKLYIVLLEVARSSTSSPETRVVALKALVRLRSDINYAIFIVKQTESQSLAAALCRTVGSVSEVERVEGAQPKPRTEEQPVRLRHQATSSDNSSLSRTNSSAGRSLTNNTSRVTRPTPPLWMYPGPKGLPEDPPIHSSHLVFSHLENTRGHESPQLAHSGVLDISLWLEVVVDLLNTNNLDWEIYSYLIVHLGAQLSNHSLFVDAIPQIKVLRRLVCDKISRKNFVDPPSFSNLKKSDAGICFYQILTMLISYSAHFNKDEEQDSIVKTLVLGIGTHEKTSEMCIHGLSICCHELPLLLVRYLAPLVERMAAIYTQSNVAAPILEFISTLARLPELFRNFTNEDYAKVFGLCFRYVQYVRDKNTKNVAPSSRASKSSAPGSRGSRELTLAMDNYGHASTLGDALPQYIHALTYHAITFWFMALRLQDRQGQIERIMQSLKYTDDHGREVMDEQGQLIVDMMYRVAHSNQDETAPDANFAQYSDGYVTSKSYLAGASILTIETSSRTGVSQVATRRPSGTLYHKYVTQSINSPRHQVPVTFGAADDDADRDDQILFMPEHVLHLMYSPYTVYRYGPSPEAPVLLPDDEATKRAINSFDRISALDGHKAGIIYVGEGQTSESEILSNVMGSADYMDFLNGIGTLMELKDASFNTQGLDHNGDADGKFTYCWRDRVTELVFHVTTMMPTDLQGDPNSSGKKRHTGNDYVNIIFNNSGLPFVFDTFPSALNFVNIVITPEARASFVETRIYANGQSWAEKFYKVTVMTKEGLPNISPAAETKTISGTALPGFVRLLALNASVFSQVWAQQECGGYSSSWLNRFRQINRLRERHGVKVQATESSKNVTSQEAPQASRQTRTATPEPQRTSTLFRRVSVATLFSDNSSARHSGVSASEDLERTSSGESRSK